MHELALHFLLPFALPAAAEGAAVLPARATPALDTLLRYASRRDRVLGEDFQRSLPHESWLAAQYGLIGPNDDGDAPIAPYMLLADGGVPGDARWACVQPVHVQIAHDHLVLIDPENLALPDTEAETLLAHVRPVIASLGLTLVTPTPLRWYISDPADAVEKGAFVLGEVIGASPLRAAGRSIEIWLPHDAATGKRSRAWMKLQNEIQMAWHEHPVNEAREARRQLAANSVWLHGQGTLKPVRRPFSAVFSHAAASRGLGQASGVFTAPVPDTFAPLLHALPPSVQGQAQAQSTAPSPGAAVLIELGALATPFLSQDWGSWLPALADIDTRWLAPALDALRAGQLARIDLTLCSDTGSTTISVRRIDLKKFWRRGTLQSLLIG